MFDVLGVDEDFTVDGLELIGAWSKHLRDDVRSFPWRRELVAVLVALDEVEHQVPDVEGPTLATLASTWPSGGGQHHVLHLAGQSHPRVVTP